ncbi:MAG: polymerase sigma factor FliA, partial [Micromonosporaceae bacterium]|nr:polymerase sigma factor FliA [Micromonosporaceae bacterium]
MTAPAATASATQTVLSGRELEELVRNHLPLVGHLVREMLTRLPAHICREDLVS